MSSLVMQMRSRWHKKLNLLKVNRDLTDEEKEQTKQRQREGHARRPDEEKEQTKQRQREGHVRRPNEAKKLQQQRRVAKRAIGYDEAKSSITVPNTTNSHGEVMYSTPYLAVKSVCDFGGDDKMKRIAASTYIVSMGWVPIGYIQLQRYVKTYREGKWKKEDKRWLTLRPTAKPPAKKRKTVEEDNNDFSNEDEEEFDEDIVDDSEDDFVPAPAPVSVSRIRRGTKRITYTVDSDSDDDFEFDE
jgi:hypothetical protein